MKKSILMIIVLVLGFCLFADNASDSIPLLLLGHINASTQFSVSIDGTVPFDLESDSVQKTGNPETQIMGIKIGSYSLSSTGVSFNLFVLHDKFQLTERLFGTEYEEGYDPGTKESIDYRLYIETGSSGGGFLSCKSSSFANLSSYSSLNNPENLGEYIRISGNVVDVDSRGLYVVLDDDDTSASELKAGLYASTLYFYMEV